MKVQVALVLATLTYGLNGHADCVLSGGQTAKVTIEEFVDMECAYCAKGANTIEQIAHEYAGKVRVIYRNMPLASHSGADNAAKALTAVCMNNPHLAAAFEKSLFDHQAELVTGGEPVLFEIAAKLNIDGTVLKSEMASQQVQDIVSADLRKAAALGLTGTPSFLIGSEKVVGARPIDEMRKIVDRQLSNY